MGRAGGLKIVCLCVSDLRVSGAVCRVPSPPPEAAGARLNQRNRLVSPA